MIIKKKAISLSIPIKVYEMLEELTEITFSTKTKIIVDAIRREYRIYKADIGEPNMEEKENVS